MSADRPTIFFVHQNCPAQFRYLAPKLAEEKFNVFFITNGNFTPPGVTRVHYPGDFKDVSPEISMFSYAKMAAKAALHLQRTNGIRPDIIVGHASWGELMYLRDMYPNTPLIGYFEWFHSENTLSSFDPAHETHADAKFIARVKNIPIYVSSDICSVGITPTWWQYSSFPVEVQKKLQVIFDGTDTVKIRRPSSAKLKLPSGQVLSSDDEVVTYVGRSLEPVRGFPTAMRAIAELCQRRPNAQFVIIGRDMPAYGNPTGLNDSHRERMLSELEGKLDLRRIHFLGNVSYENFLNTLYISSAHIYLTYPFILSWSMLEAMAAECLIFGSRTAPVQEVIVDRHNGVLVEFHDHMDLAAKVEDALRRPDQYQSLRLEARRTILERYDLHSISLPRQKALINSLL